MHRVERDSERWKTAMIRRDAKLYFTLTVHKLRFGMKLSSFIHVEHANHMNDLFNSGVLESIHWSCVCKFVCIPLILLCENVTLICRLWFCILRCHLLSTCTYGTIWQRTLRLMYRFLWSCCTLCPLKVHICTCQLIWILSFCPYFVADRGEALPVCFWKVHLNPYDSNCILLRLIHPENRQVTGNQQFIIPGMNVTVQVKWMWQSVPFPPSIPQLLIQPSNR